MGPASWLILGIVLGVVASQITRRTRWQDYLINIVVGAIGAFAGGFMTNLVSRDPVFGFTLISFIMAGLGAGITLSVAAAVRR